MNVCGRVPLALFVAALGIAPPVRAACVPCTIVVSRAPTPIQLVERAALIVHVRARAHCERSAAECTPLPNSLVTVVTAEGATGPASSSSGDIGATGLIEFDLVDVIKGPSVPKIIRIPGDLVADDDFNDQPVPYTFVRKGGRSGNCFAFGYRSGAEYVLLLRPGTGGLTPYWAALAPINEQVRGPQDPWVVWLKEQATRK